MNKRIALYGGSFDPPHNGHLMVAHKLSRFFDMVIIMPTFVSPFKPQGASAEAAHRINMLNIMTGSKKRITVSDYEALRGDISYTIDTVEHLKQQHPDHDIYLVIGSENLQSLHMWKDFARLRQMVSFFVIKRPNYDCEPDKDMVIAPFLGTEVSSTQCRVALSFNAADGLMDRQVIDYIEKNKLYMRYNKYVDEFKNFRLSISRVQHIYYSTICGIRLAKQYNVDVERVIVALLLHDIGKSLTGTEQALQYVRNPKMVEELPFAVQHAEIGAQVAEYYFDIKDIDIINAIRYHTSARAGMSVIEEIVFLADKIEESRTYFGVEQIRRAAQQGLKGAMALSLQETIKKLARSGREVAETTLAALEYYKEVE